MPTLLPVARSVAHRHCLSPTVVFVGMNYSTALAGSTLVRVLVTVYVSVSFMYLFIHFIYLFFFFYVPVLFFFFPLSLSQPGVAIAPDDEPTFRRIFLFSV